MDKILIATVRQIHIRSAKEFALQYLNRIGVEIVTTKEGLVSAIESYCPDIIFFPHWSWLIPPEIYETKPCVVFHTSDLPVGRGGSPIQNQIAAGVLESHICALKAAGELDAGDIYLKLPISLLGTADEIAARISAKIFGEMIPRIVFERLAPKPQQGAPVVFKRRVPAQSEVSKDMTLEQLFHHIQMLDGEGYPPAFADVSGFKLEFTRASLKPGYIHADVRIERKE